MAIEHKAALFYSWSIPYIVNRAPVTDTCQRTKHSNKPPLEQVIILHVHARDCMDITMDFLNMSPVFTYCSTLYPNIPLEDDNMIWFSRLWTIVCTQSGFMFLIPVLDNLTVEKSTDTFDTHVASVISYPYYIDLIVTLSLCQTISMIRQRERESSWNRPSHTTLRQTVSQKLPTSQSSSRTSVQGRRKRMATQTLRDSAKAELRRQQRNTTQSILFIHRL